MNLGKRYGDTIRRVVLSSYFLALPVSLPFVLVFLSLIEKYEIETTWMDFNEKQDELDFWADVNADGLEERIY